MNIICLRFFMNLSESVAAMNHSTMHWYGRIQDALEEAIALGFSHGIDASFGQGQID